MMPSISMFPRARPAFVCHRGRGMLIGVAFALLAGTPGIALADDGDPDPTFSGDGRALFQWPATYQGADVVDARTHGVAVLADGSTVTVSTFQTVGADRFDACAVTKFDAAGSIDATFGAGGWQLVYFGPTPSKDDCLGIFPAPGNGIFVVGDVQSMSAPYEQPALLKLHANGSLDTSFGVGGKAIVTSQPFAGAEFFFRNAIQAPDGKILLVGSCGNCGHGTPEDFTAVRINTNGSVDTSFGNAGWVSFGRSENTGHYLLEAATAAAIDTQGRVVLGGYSQAPDDVNDQQRPLLVRTTPSGQLDTTFNATGYVDFNVFGSYATSAIAIDPYNDGIVLAANITNTANVVPGALLMRTKRDGTADTGFGGSGLVLFQEEEGTNISALAFRRDRRLTAAGWIDPTGSSTRRFFAARMFFYGTLDNTFDADGINKYTFAAASTPVGVPTAMVLSGERPVIAGTLVDSLDFPQIFATGVLRLQSDVIFKDGLE
ncbi:MAG: hypothetical protein ABIW82_17590 [Dokdonella sp.]